MKQKHIAEIGLLTCALFWGASGVLTQIALVETTPLGLTFLRFLLASILGIVCFRVNPFKQDKLLVKHSLVLAGLLIVIYISSTYGLKYTTASNAGFIIGSAVVLVPILNALVFKQSPNKKDMISSSICFIGLALVTLKGGQNINKGDLFCLIDAFAYSFYIIYNSRLKHDVNIKALTTLQYSFVGIFTLVYLLIFETIPVISSSKAIISVILLGVFCTFLAFFIQVMAQKNTSAENASRILTFIPVFTVAFDRIIFGVQLTPLAMLGGLCVILATLLMDLNLKRQKEQFQLFLSKH